MAKTPDRAAKIRELYLSLPDTEETPTWGSPHFRVAGKIFGGFGEEGGITSIGLKLEMEHADAMVASDPRFTRARYVGHKGWVSIDVSSVVDWEEMRQLVLESYRLIAPKRTLAKLSGSLAARPGPRASQTKPAAANRAASKTRGAKAGTATKPLATGRAAEPPAQAKAVKKPTKRTLPLERPVKTSAGVQKRKPKPAAKRARPRP